MIWRLGVNGPTVDSLSRPYEMGVVRGRKKGEGKGGGFVGRGGWKGAFLVMGGAGPSGEGGDN